MTNRSSLLVKLFQPFTFLLISIRSIISEKGKSPIIIGLSISPYYFIIFYIE